MAEKQPMPVTKEAGAPAEITRGPFVSLRNEIDRVFDEFMSWPVFRGNLPGWSSTRLGLRRPREAAADVIERDNEYEIDIDVPGVGKDNIEVVLSDGSLVVRCNIAEEAKEEGVGYTRYERRHQAFSRAFDLPSGVDVDKIAADLENGVLSITLPKTPEAQQKQRKIEVKSH